MTKRCEHDVLEPSCFTCHPVTGDLRPAGYYHTGLDSFDSPRIKHYARPEPYDMGIFETGPFGTFQEAKQDLLKEFKTLRDAMIDALRLVRSLKPSSKEESK